jgi:hypothetical protein
MTRYNERLGATATARSYVPLGERRRFIDAMSARTGAWAARVALGEAPDRTRHAWPSGGKPGEIRPRSKDSSMVATDLE